MSEPRTIATGADEVVPGVWHWTLHDERIDFVSDSYALASDEGVVLIDPLPLAEESLRGLGAVVAICLTCGSHQRSAWRYRRELDEEPDERYSHGVLLPGKLRASFTPGAGCPRKMPGGDQLR